MLKRLAFALIITFALPVSGAIAETCGGIYTVKRGDALSAIADRLYHKASMWSVIHSNNIDRIGENPNRIRVGMKLRLTCVDGLPTGLPGGAEVTAAAVTPAAPVVVVPGTGASAGKINVLGGDDYKPFIDRSLPGGGLLTHVVQTAMEAANPPEGFAIHWVNDWSAHLEPLLSNALLDLGYGWFQPACDTMPDSYRCQNFDFSDPIFEVLVLLYVHKDRAFAFNSDADILGKTLCRPKGFFTHDLEKDGRRWLSEGKITLATPILISDCFEALIAGEVDAVAVNEFTGRAAMKELGIKDQVEIISTRPLSIEGMHVLVHKTHPRAQELIELVNSGLSMIRRNGEYQKIIDQHMTRIWADF